MFNFVSVYGHYETFFVLYCKKKRKRVVLSDHSLFCCLKFE